ncbi:uncharacterized protein FIBRA_06455 [Fibroporia radiculosa]|uniref:Uncharacterized protein n=1 Tax=Fibroporia radiculosa TaxID=599839 RepID=J4H431_9APHY|nr:uncharacterized protein FIBRA_06455 [Fibroporia radiculosa]CCM04284.1 predicted protein [Fibroporia radiculosa]
MRLSLAFAALLPLVVLAIPTTHIRSSAYEKDLSAVGSAGEPAMHMHCSSPLPYPVRIPR